MTAYELLKRTPVRLAIAFTALFAVTVIAIFSGLYGSLAHELEKRIRSNVEQTAEALRAIDRERGFDDLQAVVSSESNSVRDIGTIFLLLDEKGAYLAGNVRNIERFEDWRLIKRDSLELLSNGKRHAGDHFHAIWTPVSKGALLVGGSDREIRAIQRQLLRGLAWGWPRPSHWQARARPCWLGAHSAASTSLARRCLRWHGERSKAACR